MKFHEVQTVVFEIFRQVTRQDISVDTKLVDLEISLTMLDSLITEFKRSFRYFKVPENIDELADFETIGDIIYYFEGQFVPTVQS